MAAINPIFPGEKFGLLTVISYCAVRKSYKCSCSCGGETFARSAALRSGKHSSCSCGRVRTRPSARLNEDKGPKKEVYRKYVAAAKRRKIPFEIEEEDFVAFFGKNCKYCGIKPSTTRKMYSCKTESRYFTYNGVDRVDNTLGYVEGNCEPCCSICNNAKASLSLQEWKSWITRVSLNIK